jgi:hypothetical protein
MSDSNPNHDDAESRSRSCRKQILWATAAAVVVIVVVWRVAVWMSLIVS